jgi:hypothetical protein
MHSYSKNGRPSLGYSIIVLAWLKKEEDSQSAYFSHLPVWYFSDAL